MTLGPTHAYESPFFAKFEPHRHHETGRMVCPCGVRHPAGFDGTDRYGNPVVDRFPLIVTCAYSGHIITADGVVIGRREEKVA